jgi:hypothetical protein
LLLLGIVGLPGLTLPAGEQDGGQVALKFTAFERGEPFYQVVETQTEQTVTIAGQASTRKQRQALYVRWAPLDRKDGKLRVRQQVIGHKLTIEAGGKTISYDSTAPAETQPEGPGTEFFKALLKQELTYTVGPNLEVVGVDGRTQLIQGLNEAIPAAKTLLDTLLSEKAVRRMPASLWSALPPRPVGVGETWQTAGELDLGPLGKHATASTHTFQGAQGDEARVRSEVMLTYQEPKERAGLPFTILSGALTGKGGGEAVFNLRKGRFDSVRTVTKVSGRFSILAGDKTTELTVEQEQTAMVRCLDASPLGQGAK